MANRRKPARWLIVISILVLLVAIVTTIATRLATQPEYIGEAIHDGSQNCYMHEWPAILSKTRMAAQVRGTDCNTDVLEGSTQYFVFVRAPYQPNLARNLAFRFLLDPRNVGTDDCYKPDISWVTPDTLRILVRTDGYIEDQVMKLSGVTIVYNLTQNEPKDTKSCWRA